MVMKKVFEKILLEKKDSLAIIPTYADFEDYAYECGVSENDVEIRNNVRMFLEDFTEIEIKKRMLSEAEYKKNGGKYCSAKDVERFEKQGRVISIGTTIEEYINEYGAEYFESEEEKESYIKEYIVPVKYGIVDYVFS